MYFVFVENRRILHFLNDSNHWPFCSTLGRPKVFPPQLPERYLLLHYRSCDQQLHMPAISDWFSTGREGGANAAFALPKHCG
jgi:hypothetical protein